MNLKTEEGGALIEVIVSMVILALLVTGLNASILTLVNSNIASKELSAATNNGYQQLEKLRRTNYDDIGPGNDIINNKYFLTWQLNGGGTTQKIISLTVVWPLQSQKHTISFSTIIAKP